MFCGKCGTEIQEKASFCPNCGNKIHTDITSVDKKKPHKGLKILLLIISVVLIIAIVLGILWLSNKDNKEVISNSDKSTTETSQNASIDKTFDSTTSSDYEIIVDFEEENTQNNVISDSKQKLIMATNATFPPFEYIENGNYVGIDIEIATCIAEELGMELVIEDIAFDEIIPGVSIGKYDIGVAAVVINNERKKLVDFSNVYYSESYNNELIEYGIAINKNETELADKINLVIDKLKNNGDLQKIINKYVTN